MILARLLLSVIPFGAAFFGCSFLVLLVVQPTGIAFFDTSCLLVIGGASLLACLLGFGVVFGAFEEEV